MRDREGVKNPACLHLKECAMRVIKWWRYTLFCEYAKLRLFTSESSTCSLLLVHLSLSCVVMLWLQNFVAECIEDLSLGTLGFLCMSLVGIA